jgi:hypothetical protein
MQINRKTLEREVSRYLNQGGKIKCLPSQPEPHSFSVEVDSPYETLETLELQFEGSMI